MKLLDKRKGMGLMFKRNKMHWAVVSAIILSMVLITSCAKKEKTQLEKVINVRLGTPEKRTVRPYIMAVGTLKPFDEVIISPEVDGIIKTVNIDEGRIVKKGDVLAEINDIDFKLDQERAQAGLKQAEASLTNTKTEYQRKETLLKEELVTRQQFDDVSTRLIIASSDLDRARATMSLARQRLSKTRIISPVNGAVKEKKLTTGDFARASVPLASIIIIDPLKLVFSIGEKDVTRIKISQEVTFTIDTFKDREFKGKVSTIYPGLDEKSRTLTIEALVPNGNFSLKAGFFAQVKVYTEIGKETVLIPTTAIVYDELKSKVFILDGDTAREIVVKPGETYGDMIEILEGLSGGEKIVIVGQNTLAGGVKVNVLK
jgi:membrane fusion protein, multidrug efflux system